MPGYRELVFDHDHLGGGIEPAGCTVMDHDGHVVPVSRVGTECGRTRRHTAQATTLQ